MKTYGDEMLKRIADELRDIRKEMSNTNKNLEKIATLKSEEREKYHWAKIAKELGIPESRLRFAVVMAKAKEKEYENANILYADILEHDKKVLEHNEKLKSLGDDIAKMRENLAKIRKESE